jgi:hypothetical protein
MTELDRTRIETYFGANLKEQYEWFKEAIDNWWTFHETLSQMQRFNREELFESLPIQSAASGLARES